MIKRYSKRQLKAFFLFPGRGKSSGNVQFVQSGTRALSAENTGSVNQGQSVKQQLYSQLIREKDG